MMYLPAKAQVLLSARCHKVGFSQQSWVLMMCLSPEAQHYDFEECSVFGWHKQTPDASTSHAELVTSLTYNTVLWSLHVHPHTAMHLYMTWQTCIGTCTPHAQHMQSTCTAHALHMHGTCTAHAQHMHG